MGSRKQSQQRETRVVPVDDIRELVQMMHEFALSEIEWRDGERHLRLAKQAETPEQQAPPPALPPAYYPPPYAPFVFQANPSAAPPAQAAPSQPQSPAEVEAGKHPEEEDEESRYVAIRSPMVGTFYAAPAPEKPPFVEVGSHVEPDTIVCIIEAMKVFNEIPAEVSGKIVKVLVENGQPVEYGQPLFLVDPTG